MMADQDSLASLNDQLARVLARHPAGDPTLFSRLPGPAKLTDAAQRLSQKFVEGKPSEPPSQARINALARLRRNDPSLTRRDWNLIGWGLCDDCGRAGRPIESADMIGQVLEYLDLQAARQGIGRRFWFGLLHSYFAYSSQEPSSNANWVALRARLVATAEQLISSQRRRKAWAQVLEENMDLLSPEPGARLAHAILEGNTSITTELKSYLPVPEGSWLWQRLISEQILLVSRVADETFYAAIPAMLHLAAQHSQQTDAIIAALLTRYQASAKREQAHEELKQVALAHWQNPQIKMANRWALVSDEVRKMVLHWFAVADLQHFFSLLQGAGGVDRDRLNYWLRFVEQISYTRIVMGGDAFASQDPNFVDFREKNRGRFSALHGGDTANNAFVMRIGDYYFVEFSGKGNACYIYQESRVPFSAESKFFTIGDLKRKAAATDRIIHNGSWQRGADWLLGRLGIYPHARARSARVAGEFTLPSVELSSTSPAESPMLPVTAAPPASSALPPVPSPADVSIPPVPMLEGGRASPFAGLFMPPPSDSRRKGDPTTMKQLLSNEILRMPIKQEASKQIPPSPGQAVRIAMEIQAVVQAGFTDHRHQGGAFWVMEVRTDSELAKQLTALGFKYREGRGHWIK
jgi:hypothetical protein